MEYAMNNQEARALLIEFLKKAKEMKPDRVAFLLGYETPPESMKNYKAIVQTGINGLGTWNLEVPSEGRAVGTLAGTLEVCFVASNLILDDLLEEPDDVDQYEEASGAVRLRVWIRKKLHELNSKAQTNYSVDVFRLLT